MQQAGVTPDIRPVVAAANEAARRTGEPAMAIQLRTEKWSSARPLS